MSPLHAAQEVDMSSPYNTKPSIVYAFLSCSYGSVTHELLGLSALT
jgi:hypothetical protein